MTISVASGKGGTGKTTVAVGLALALEQQVQLLDCDVEEPNSHLFLQLEPELKAEQKSGAEAAAEMDAATSASPEIEGRPGLRRSEDFSILVPRIDPEKCTACGLCSSFCEYNALARLKDKLLVFDNLCHGCGGCKIVCPEGAISEHPRPIGKLVSAAVPGVDLLYGDLNSGEVLAPPLIRAVKRRAGGAKAERSGIPLGEPGGPDGPINPEGPGGPEASRATENTEAPEGDKSLPVIIDSPPGTTCPMVTAVKDSDFSLLVTENTPFGLHDLELAVEVLSNLDMPMGVVINRADIGRSDVEEFCRKKNLPVLMRIPYSREIAEFYARGESIVAADPDFRRRFQDMYSRIEALVAERRAG